MYYTNDLRTHLDILTMVLTVEDSWQDVRLLYALKGIPILSETITNNDNPSSSTTLNNNYDAPQSLFDIFSKSKSSYQKRAYQFVKMLLQLFTK
jgi:hypothetical protein